MEWVIDETIDAREPIEHYLQLRKMVSTICFGRQIKKSRNMIYAFVTIELVNITMCSFCKQFNENRMTIH